MLYTLYTDPLSHIQPGHGTRRGLGRRSQAGPRRFFGDLRLLKINAQQHPRFSLSAFFPGMKIPGLRK